MPITLINNKKNRRVSFVLTDKQNLLQKRTKSYQRRLKQEFHLMKNWIIVFSVFIKNGTKS
jgi:hypothetical protein